MTNTKYTRRDKHRLEKTRQTHKRHCLPVAQLGESWEEPELMRRGKPVGRDTAPEWFREDPERARCTEGG